MEKSFIKSRIKEKIKEIEEYLQELSEIRPSNFEEYEKNFEKRATCERYAEKIPEALVDLAVLTIKYKNLPYPQDDKNAFEILAKNNIISEKLSERLQDAKGMRNIIAHEYGKINNEIVFESITSELEEDAKEFINKIVGV